MLEKEISIKVLFKICKLEVMISGFQLQLILQVQHTSTLLLQWCGESEIGAQSLIH